MIPMTHVTFDTLKFVEKLIVAGMPAAQAKALSEAQKEVFEEVLDHTLSTKADLIQVKNELKVEINEVKAEIVEVKSELKAEIAEVKADVKQFNAEVKLEFQQLRTEMKAGDRLLHWMIGFVLAGVAALILKAFF